MICMNVPKVEEGSSVHGLLCSGMNNHLLVCFHVHCGIMAFPDSGLEVMVHR